MHLSAEVRSHRVPDMKSSGEFLQDKHPVLTYQIIEPMLYCSLAEDPLHEGGFSPDLKLFEANTWKHCKHAISWSTMRENRPHISANPSLSDQFRRWENRENQELFGYDVGWTSCLVDRKYDEIRINHRRGRYWMLFVMNHRMRFINQRSNLQKSNGESLKKMR